MGHDGPFSAISEGIPSADHRSHSDIFRRDATGHARTLNGGFHGNIYELVDFQKAMIN